MSKDRPLWLSFETFSGVWTIACRVVNKTQKDFQHTSSHPSARGQSKIFQWRGYSKTHLIQNRRKPHRLGPSWKGSLWTKSGSWCINLCLASMLLFLQHLYFTLLLVGLYRKTVSLVRADLQNCLKSDYYSCKCTCQSYFCTMFRDSRAKGQQTRRWLIGRRPAQFKVDWCWRQNCLAHLKRHFGHSLRYSAKLRAAHFTQSSFSGCSKATRQLCKVRWQSLRSGWMSWICERLHFRWRNWFWTAFFSFLSCSTSLDS